MDFVPRKKLNEIVKKYKLDKKYRKFSFWDQYLAMSFGQLSGKDSIRGLCLCLNAHEKKLYHLGFRSRIIARKTLHDANEKRNYKIYEEFALELIKSTKKLYGTDDNPFDFEYEKPIYALDSSTVDLCLNIFPWAKFRKKKGAIKMHTMIDLNGNIPTFISITDGKVHDVNILDEIQIELGAFYIMDRAYICYERLHKISKKEAFFVLREKKNTRYKRVYSHEISPEDKKLGISCDQSIFFEKIAAKQKYPEKLRRVKIYDKKKKKYLVFLTNNFSFSAKEISMLYKQRWQIELFFKWIKQHLEIKKFWGYSKNSVKTQIWICISNYLILCIMKKKLDLTFSPYELLQILGPSLFDKNPLDTLLSTGSLQNNLEYSQQTALDLG